MPLKLVAPRPGKSPYWSVRGTYLGVYVDRSTKASSRNAAARFLTKWKDEIERRCFARPGEPTFLDAAVAYMADNGEDRFLKKIIEKIGRTLFREIAQEDIDSVAIALYPKATPATRNRQVYTPSSAILKHAGEVKELRRPKGWRGKSRTVWLQPEDAFRLFEAADHIDAEFGLFLRVLCYTGMRLGDATGCNAEHLELQQAYLLVGKTKNGEPRGVHLPPHLVAALANHPRGLDRPGQKLFKFRKCGRLYTLLKRTKELAGPSGAFRGSFHVFCHTWATWMRRYGGLDTSGLVATTRWKDAASARRYEHVVTSEESRKADLLPVENQWKRAV